MSINFINPNRVVPVQEDLTTPDTQLEIIRGWEKMFRVDKEFTEDFVKGEWAVLGDNDKLTRPGLSPVRNTYLVLQGTDRSDVAATGKVGIVMNSKIIARTTMYNPANLHVGTPLTVKDLGTGTAYLTLAAGGDPVLAYVSKLGSNFVEFETV